MAESSDQDRRGRWTILAIAALSVALTIYFGAGFLASARDAAREPPAATLPLVEVVNARAVPQTFPINEEGFLRPRAEIDVVPEVSGKVVEVAPQLEPGGRFDRGEVLFRIDARIYEAELKRARAELSAARADLERAASEDARQQRLQAIGAAAEARQEQAKAELAAARSRVGQAEAAVIRAEKQLEDTVIRAPFNASVISENVALGRFVQPGESAARIFDTGAGEIVLGLMPADARSVRRALQDAGDEARTVTVTPSRASASAGELTGMVKRFGQAVDERSRTVPLVIEVPGAFNPTREASVFANDFVSVELTGYSPVQLYAVPNGVVREEGFVWTLRDDDTLESVPVEAVHRTARETVFRSDTDLGDRRLVLTALTEEAEGLKVAVAERPAARGETLR